jgi:hypothetical protein
MQQAEAVQLHDYCGVSTVQSVEYRAKRCMGADEFRL